MVFNTEMLSRIQFAFTISFHIIFPSFSIGLATFLAIMEGAWLKTNKPIYYNICKFWMKVFAFTFGMGVVSGLVMAFQFGTNWAGFAHEAGPVLGALFTYEVLTAFFIEAGFLGVMIFGWKKVGPKLHYLATLLVVVGVTLSAFWILAANSWMQTPGGAVLEHGVFHVTSWFHVIFNRSLIPRYFHMLIAAYLASAVVIAGVSAFYLLKKKHLAFAKKCFSFALLTITILMPLQLFIGDQVGLEVHNNQPIKTAAMEGIWKTQSGAPFILFAIPDQQQEKNFWQISIPHGASLINTHQWNGKLTGLDSVPRSDQPMVAVVFYSFRIMVLMGLLMLATAMASLWLRRRAQLYDTQWFLKSCIWLTPVGFIAILTGWFTAEVGRQPWVVYHLMRTVHAVSNISVDRVWISLAMIILVYGIIFGVFYFRYIFKIIRIGPAKLDDEKPPFAYMSQFIQAKKEDNI